MKKTNNGIEEKERKKGREKENKISSQVFFF